MISNDPQKPAATITLGCSIKQYIAVTPTNHVIVAGYKGDKIKKEVTITSLGGPPLKITGITSDIDDKIKYKLKTIKKGEKYSLEIKNRSSQGGGVRGKIELKTNNEKKPRVVVRVNIRIIEEVKINPKSISFGTIDISKEDANKIFAKSITLKDTRGDGLTIKKIKTSSDWIMTETKTKRDGKISTIIVTLDKDKLPKGPFEEKIKIRTSYKKKYLEIDVIGKVI